MNKGFTFKEAQAVARGIMDKYRWVYGTRTLRWHYIDRRDRDYKEWGIPNEKFMGMTEAEALTDQLSAKDI